LLVVNAVASLEFSVVSNTIDVFKLVVTGGVVATAVVVNVVGD
jgi:hypothetical protein